MLLQNYERAFFAKPSGRQRRRGTAKGYQPQALAADGIFSREDFRFDRERTYYGGAPYYGARIAGAAAVGAAGAIATAPNYYGGGAYYGGGPYYGPGAVAIGTAGAFAAAPFHYGGLTYYDGSAYYGGWDAWARIAGIKCRPGTLVKLDDGLMRVCQ